MSKLDADLAVVLVSDFLCVKDSESSWLMIHFSLFLGKSSRESLLEVCKKNGISGF
jgi:hypothetical protein